MSTLVETISKKPIPAHVKSLVMEICVNDRTEEDVEVPYVKLNIKS
jgi:ubiquitin-activating enzyme E1